MKEIAHFFWHGQLSKLEIGCIKSFIKHGFQVKVWSYNGLKIPGAESCDARLVLPESHITKYSQGESKSPSLAAFSDVFRYKLLYDYGGWWFDTDCVCLKDSSEFTELRKNKPIVAGYQTLTSIAVGVLYLEKSISAEITTKIDAMLEQHNYHLPVWGSIGPKLVTIYINDNNLSNHISDMSAFYPIHWDDARILLDPNKLDEVLEIIDGSYIIHVWDSILVNKMQLDKNKPPKGSFLHHVNNIKSV